MGKYLKVKQAIKRKFPAIESDSSLGAAIDLMTKEDVSVLVVNIEGEPAGLITASDVVQSLANDHDLEKTKISTFMTGCRIDEQNPTNKICAQLDEDDDVTSAFKVMYAGGINHLFVTGVKNKLLGVVSNLDLIKLIASK